MIVQSTARPTGVRLGRLVAFCLDVVFPPVCARCGRLGELLCPGCQGQMQWVSGPICGRCGRSLVGQGPYDPSSLCSDCVQTPLSLTQMRAPLRYEEPTSQIIHRLKYEGYYALARPLSQFLIAGWPDWDRTPDLIVPIPLHARRQRRRGYNQSELLARPLASALGLAFDAHALHRTRHTAPQVGLGPAERAANVSGAFAAEPGAVRGRQVLLIDDVLTTGATMTSAAEALLAVGAASVSAYCLARVS